MSDSGIKALRGQVRQVVQETMPKILSDEMKTELYKKVSEDIDARLKALEEGVRNTLDRLNSRSEEIMKYLIRQQASSAPSLPIQLVSEEKPSEQKEE